MRRARHAQGFTVVELLMVMVMIGVMIALAAPNMRELIVRMRLKTAAGDLHSALVTARSEAIKRNATAQVVPSDPANWAAGWSVVATIPGAGNETLTRQDPYANITVTTTTAAYVPAAVAAVTFSGTGRETGSAGAGIAFIIKPPGTINAPARCVVLDPSGRPQVKQDRDMNTANGCN